MKLLKLSGKHAIGDREFAIVDDYHYENLVKYNWCILLAKTKKLKREYPYVIATINGRNVLMHRFLMGVNETKIKVDHINHNTLDNRIENLRACTHRENLRNRKPVLNSTSKYLGVFKLDDTRWKATIRQLGNQYFIGHFSSEKDAAEAYDMCALHLHKDYANLNFPDNEELYKGKINQINPLTFFKKTPSSQYHGVHWSTNAKRWMSVVFIRETKKRVCVGRFHNEIDAAKAHDSYLKENSSDLRKLNFS